MGTERAIHVGAGQGNSAVFFSSIGITSTCYRTEKAQVPKSAGVSAGKSAGKRGIAGGTAER